MWQGRKRISAEKLREDDILCNMDKSEMYFLFYLSYFIFYILSFILMFYYYE